MAALDPLMVLPPELALHILSYLKPTQSWAVRRVSKSWNAFLKSERVLEDVLRSAETHDPQDGLPGDLEQRLQVFKSQITGPAGHITFKFAPTPSTLEQYRWPTLKGEHLAFIYEQDKIKVMNLVSRQPCMIKARSKILKLALTNWMAIYTLDDSVNWHALDGSARGKHNIRASAIAGYGDHLAALSHGRLLIFNRNGLFSELDMGASVLDEVALLLRPDMCLIASSGWRDIARVRLDQYKVKYVEWVKFDNEYHRKSARLTSWLADGLGAYSLTCDSGVGGRIHLERLRETWEVLPFGMTSSRWKDRLYDECLYLRHHVVIWPDSYVLQRTDPTDARHNQRELMINDNFFIVYNGIEYPIEVFTFHKAGRMIRGATTTNLDKLRNWNWVHISHEHPDLLPLKKRMR